jgi:hypothetical protein
MVGETAFAARQHAIQRAEVQLHLVAKYGAGSARH